jgi:hypothetical protein
MAATSGVIADRALMIILQGNCFQCIVHFLTATEGCVNLSKVSKTFRSLRSNVTLSTFDKTDRKHFITRVLRKSILRTSVVSFGIIENRLNCSRVTSLVKFFQGLTPVFEEDDDSFTVLKIIASKEELTTLRHGKVSSRLLKSASLLQLSSEVYGAWVLICAFQCNDMKSNSLDHTQYMAKGKGPCRRSYSIRKCSSDKCDQPYISCESCSLSCYDCDAQGFCFNCILETPNCGEIVFVCEPCRGYCQ